MTFWEDSKTEQLSRSPSTYISKTKLSTSLLKESSPTKALKDGTSFIDWKNRLNHSRICS